MDAWLQFVVAALATWRVTHLVVSEDGPWDAVTRLRRLAGDGFWGSLMDCFYCASMWVAAATAACIAPRRWPEWPLYWLALSGAACLLEKWKGREL
jgi:hypothetical protein